MYLPSGFGVGGNDGVTVGAMYGVNDAEFWLRTHSSLATVVSRVPNNYHLAVRAQHSSGGPVSLRARVERSATAAAILSLVVGMIGFAAQANAKSPHGLRLAFIN